MYDRISACHKLELSMSRMTTSIQTAGTACHSNIKGYTRIRMILPRNDDFNARLNNAASTRRITELSSRILELDRNRQKTSSKLMGQNASAPRSSDATARCANLATTMLTLFLRKRLCHRPRQRQHSVHHDGYADVRDGANNRAILFNRLFTLTNKYFQNLFVLRECEF